MGYNVAIDGPAGAGKSTIAKLVAKEKGYIYVDTGAMYRAMALYLLNHGVNGDCRRRLKQHVLALTFPLNTRTESRSYFSTERM